MQLFFFAAATVTAQNIKLNDFEDGAADSWASWQGGASVEVVDNPSATEPNTSSKAFDPGDSLGLHRQMDGRRLPDQRVGQDFGIGILHRCRK